MTANALTAARNRGISGILAIVDQDYDTFLGLCPSDPDVIITDAHDIEMMTFESDALKRVVYELGSVPKLRELENSEIDFREPIIDAAWHVGVMRLWSLQNGLSLRFKGLRYRFADTRMRFSLSELMSEVSNHSSVPIDAAAAGAFVAKWQTTSHNRYLMCNGHDVTYLLSKALQGLIGNNSSTSTSGEQVARALRLGFSTASFVVTGVCSQIRVWETRNRPFRVLSVGL
jgi:Protein of unknown function (DUF4435)